MKRPNTPNPVLRPRVAPDAHRVSKPVRGLAPRVATATLLAVMALLAAALPTPASAAHGIRLVLQITVDQLRGDQPLRYRDRWSADGFARLYTRGAVFSDAHHGHANTETIVGHATLATGADPSVHGMIGNAWFDRATDSLRYNIEDAAFPIVGNDEGPVTKGALAKSSKSSGRSPAAMLAPTIADSIALAGNGRAKVFAVSIKDRGAVPMAGRAGKALWWSNASGEFISSTWYYPDGRLPAWARAANARREADAVAGRAWTLLLDPSTYRAAHDDAPWEVPFAGMTRTFPHVFDREALGASYYTAVSASPFGDEMLLGFARDLLAAENLGRDDVVDYLSVSFSSNDLVGHRYGPSSLESEDEILRLDRTIGALMRAADEAAGEGHVLVVLSSDHGVAEAPAERLEHGLDAGRVSMKAFESSAAAQAIVSRHGGSLFLKDWPPYVYLDREALEDRGLDPERAARELAAELRKVDGIAAAFTRDEIEGGRLPDTDLARSVARTWHSARSGDLYVVPEPGWQISLEADAATKGASSHGSPWRYDTFVPLIFEGPGVPAVTIPRRVETTAAAPTIAALLRIPPPARSTARPLF